MRRITFDTNKYVSCCSVDGAFKCQLHVFWITFNSFAKIIKVMRRTVTVLILKSEDGRPICTTCDTDQQVIHNSRVDFNGRLRGWSCRVKILVYFRGVQAHLEHFCIDLAFQSALTSTALYCITITSFVTATWLLGSF